MYWLCILLLHYCNHVDFPVKKPIPHKHVQVTICHNYKPTYIARVYAGIVSVSQSETSV